MDDFKRKLASVQVIDTVREVPEFDNLAIATLEDLGWEFLVKKNEHKSGDKVIYFEVDSLLPQDKPEFSFLDKKNGELKS